MVRQEKIDEVRDKAERQRRGEAPRPARSRRSGARTTPSPRRSTRAASGDPGEAPQAAARRAARGPDRRDRGQGPAGPAVRDLFQPGHRGDRHPDPGDHARTSWAARPRSARSRSTRPGNTCWTRRRSGWSTWTRWRRLAIERVEHSGIIFLDEVDKIAGRETRPRPRGQPRRRPARPAADHRGDDRQHPVRPGPDRPHPVHRRRRLPRVQALRPDPRASGPVPHPGRAHVAQQGGFRPHPDRARKRPDQAVPALHGHRGRRASSSPRTPSTRSPRSPRRSTRIPRTSAPGACTPSWRRSWRRSPSQAPDIKEKNDSDRPGLRPGAAPGHRQGPGPAAVHPLMTRRAAGILLPLALLAGFRLREEGPDPGAARPGSPDRRGPPPVPGRQPGHPELDNPDRLHRREPAPRIVRDRNLDDRTGGPGGRAGRETGRQDDFEKKGRLLMKISRRGPRPGRGKGPRLARQGAAVPEPDPRGNGRKFLFFSLGLRDEKRACFGFFRPAAVPRAGTSAVPADGGSRRTSSENHDSSCAGSARRDSPTPAPPDRRATTSTARKGRGRRSDLNTSPLAAAEFQDGNSPSGKVYRLFCEVSRRRGKAPWKARTPTPSKSSRSINSLPPLPRA